MSEPAMQACPICGGRGWMPGGYFSGLPMTNNEPCRPCKGGGLLWTASGQPVHASQAVEEPARGTWAAIAAGLDAYHAVNLLKALKIVPDTGDWHGSLRAPCQMVLDREGVSALRPNMTADEMRKSLAIDTTAKQ